MMYFTRFEPDQTRSAEWIACMWQRKAPADLVVHQWIYLRGEPFAMALLWEGGDETARYIADVFTGFGKAETTPAADGTEGMLAAFARDLVAWERWYRARGATDEQVAQQVELRKRAIAAPDQDAARRIGQEKRE